MTVKKNIPCSTYDFQGLQSWLDEMALQGLFFQSFSRRNDYANFQVDTPRPVRYRLDPVGKSAKDDQTRKEPYAQMGWNFVDALPKLYYVFSCEDPEVPELHSDPATLAYALNSTIRKQVRSLLLLMGISCAVMVLFTILEWKNLFWMNYPRTLFRLAATWTMILGCCLFSALQIRRLLQTRRALEQGLSPKAGRRWPRPRWLVVYLLLYVIPLYILPYFVPQSYQQYTPLDMIELSHAWPTLAQLDAAGAQPLEVEPSGYVMQNSSWCVPVQELCTMDAPDRPNLLLQYDQARFPWAARLAYRLEREKKDKNLNNRTTWPGTTWPSTTHIDQLTPFAPMDWPSLDRLEVARFRCAGQDSWAFTALRGTEVLVVEYTGPSCPEDCIGLFVTALEGKEANP